MDLPQEFYNAWDAWLERDLTACERWLRKMPRRSNLQHAKALELRAWTAAARGNYRAQVQFLSEAWPYARASGHTKTCAYILHAWSIASRDLYQAGDVACDPYHIKNFEWTEEFRLQKFHAYRGIAYVAWFDGLWGESYGYFQAAQEACPSDAWYVTLLLDRALLADVQGDRFHATAYTFEAANKAQQVDWNITDGEERLALLTLAQYPLYTEFYDRYCAIATPIKPEWGGLPGADERVRALEIGAKGRALLAQGETVHGIACLSEAFETWQRLGIRWRAAFCDVTIANVSGGQAQPKYAIELAKQIPTPWLERLVRPYSGQKFSIISKLTAAEIDVVNEICHGSANKEIAAKLNRSPNTIRNQLAQICAKLGTGSRAELVAVVVQAGFGKN